MTVLLIPLGLVLLALVMADIVWTTLAASGGGGWLTSRIGKPLWTLAKRIAGAQGHAPLRVAGVGIVVTVVLTWVALTIIGWGLVFNAAPEAVLTSVERLPAGAPDRFYFAATTVSTLGPGDLIPGSTPWRFATAAASINGLLVLTLAITYFVPVIGAVTQRRQLAMEISSLGVTPEQIALRVVREPQILGQRLATLPRPIGKLAQHHLAYPILHYFHDVSGGACGAVQVAALDEALTILAFGVDPDQRPSVDVITPVRESVGSLLNVLSASHLEAHPDVPDAPDLAVLRDAGIDTATPEEFAEAVAGLATRRTVLHGFVTDDGWTWADLRRRDDPDG